FDFINKTTKYFAAYKPSTQHIIEFYIYQMPTQVLQALPIASLLSSVICMVLMSRTNEITAMRAAGMGPIRIVAPIAIGGMILSLCSFVIGEFVAPIASQKMRYVEQVLIEKENPSESSAGNQWLRNENFIYHYSDFDMNAKTLNQLTIIEVGLNFRPKQT